MNAIQTMLARRSVKKYKSDAVPKALVEKIVEAGLRAPSGLNKQSPIVLAVTDKALRDELSKLNAANMPFAGADPFYNAPCVLVVLADKSVPTYLYDGALVMENMLLAAQELGLGACWIHRARETFETDAGKAILKKYGIEGDYEGIGNCIVGYPDGEIPAVKPVRDHRAYYAD